LQCRRHSNLHFGRVDRHQVVADVSLSHFDAAEGDRPPVRPNGPGVEVVLTRRLAHDAELWRVPGEDAPKAPEDRGELGRSRGHGGVVWGPGGGLKRRVRSAKVLVSGRPQQSATIKTRFRSLAQSGGRLYLRSSDTRRIAQPRSDAHPGAFAKARSPFLYRIAGEASCSPRT